jgi:osmotically-inducible protein OsmY
VATFLGSATALAGDAPTDPGKQQVRDEVVVTADRPSDVQITRKVMTAIQQNPYIFADHITVTTENGVVKLEGVITDLHDLLNVIRIARRAAGKRRLVNNIEYLPLDSDHD